MKQSGTTVWINTPIEELCKRLLEEKMQRPLIKELTDEEIRIFIQKKFTDRKIYYEQADITIDENPIRIEYLIEKIFYS